MNLLSPSQFPLLRQNTDVSQMSQQMSVTVTLPTVKQIEQQKTKRMLAKTFKYLNKNHDLVQFTKKIVVPKIKRNLFLEQLQRKKSIQRSNKLLMGSLKPYSTINRKQSSGEHNIYDQPTNMAKSQFLNETRYRKRRQRNYLKEGVKSLSKIQLLSSKQKDEPIAEEKYDCQSYIFITKGGKNSEYHQEDITQERENELSYNYSTKSPFSMRKQSYLSNSSNRQKARSVTKEYRDRSRTREEDQLYKSHSKFETKNHTLMAKPESRKFMKLVQVKQPSETSAHEEANQNASIISGLKALLGFANNNCAKNFQQSASTSQDDEKFAQQLQTIKSTYEAQQQQPNSQQTECLYVLLSNIAKEKNPDAIRIYKDDFAKIYIYRYGRDKITNFFDYEYIQDYDSLLELWKQNVLNFKKEEALLISFMMLDFDNDGLISHSDLFKIMTIMDNNILIKKNIYTILKHVRNHHDKSGIRDSCPQDYLKKDNFTLKKYRFMMYMKQKKKAEEQGNPLSPGSKMNDNRSYLSKSFKSQSRKSSKRSQKATSPYKERMFTLQGDRSENVSEFKFLKVFLDSITKKGQPIKKGMQSFTVNFERFKNLYKDHVPEIYYEMLYSAFGYMHPGIEYDPIDCQTPLAKRKKFLELQNVSRLDILLTNLVEMRQDRTDINKKQIRHDIKRHKRIKSMLD